MILDCWLAAGGKDVIRSWQMETTMSYQLKTKPKTGIPAGVPRQGELDLAGADRWQQLPSDDREACRQALAELLYQVITHQSQIDDHER